MDSKDPIEITKHGTSHDEKREIQEMYPICICPECMIVDTAPWYLILWVGGSTVLLIIFAVCAIVSFYDM